MQDILAQPRQKAVFVFDGGQGRLSGFLEVSLRESLGDASSPVVGYIEGWYVEPGSQRQGMGRALVQAAEAWTQAHGITELTSATELSNLGSRRAHGKLGFQESFRLVHFLKQLAPRRGASRETKSL
jgi:aminoglycoside 6'-N-acetyltransferase I